MEGILQGNSNIKGIKYGGHLLRYFMALFVLLGSAAPVQQAWAQGTEICGNGVDDDGDGLIDDFDPDCFEHSLRCSMKPPVSLFEVAEKYSTPSLSVSYNTIMVADLDQDGAPELIAQANNSYSGSPRVSKDIFILDGATGNLEETITTPFLSWEGMMDPAIADVEGDGHAEIFVATSRRNNNGGDIQRLICYAYNAGTGLYEEKWKSNVEYGYAAYQAAPNVSLADFNGDGIAEVYCLNQIFNAETGVLLAQGGANNNMGWSNTTAPEVGFFMTVAADLTPSPGLELVAGTQIYDVTITNPNGTAGNSMTVSRELTGVANAGDGTTGIADIDLDGDLDVFFTRVVGGNGGDGHLFVWDGQTNTLMGQHTYPIVYHVGLPFVGNIDGDCEPEIGYTSARSVFTFDYVPGTGLVEKWKLNTSDVSGVTGISLFDINADGISELFYRDETRLRIIDGSGNAAVDLLNMACGSGTGAERTTIADIDGDGFAEAVSLCEGGGGKRARLVVFEGAPDLPWAATRPIWNQHGYYTTHINDDLTIPRNMTNNGIITGSGASCDCSPTRAYNSFLAQTTLLDEEGCPYNPAPNLKSIVDLDECGIIGDSLAMSITLVNVGSLDFPSGAPVSMYAGNPTEPGAEHIMTVYFTDPIAIDDSVTQSFIVDVSGVTARPFDLYVVANDDGTLPLPFDPMQDWPGPNLQECDFADNRNDITTAPWVKTGSDLFECSSSTDIPVTAIGENFTGVLWRGDGTFADATSLETTYNPSAAEIAQGFADLTIETTGSVSCPETTDSLRVWISEQSTVSGGGDVFSCGSNSTVSLNGTVTGGATVEWIGAGGTFVPNANAPVVDYVPSQDELDAGITALIFEGKPNGACPGVRDTILVYFTPSPVAVATTGGSACSNNPVIDVMGNGSQNATSYTWIGGSGTFANPNSRNTQYTASASEVANGSVTVSLVASRADCAADTAQAVLTFNEAPVIEAGSNLDVCENNPVAQLNANMVNSTLGAWTGGAGVFNPSDSSLNATYTLDASEVTAGEVVLYFNSEGDAGNCVTVRDSITISVLPSPEVNAGTDISVCENNANVYLDGSVTGASGAQWSGGSGSFLPSASNLNATYQPTAAEIAAGSLTLTLTSTGNGLCNAVSDEMVITFTPAPTSDAGTDQTICREQSSISLAGVVTVGTGGVWTGGNGTFTPNASDLNATYTPTATELAQPSLTLTLTTSGNQGCNAVSDQVVFTFQDAPIVSAGADIVACGDMSNVALSGSVQNATGGRWTTLGTGTFTPGRNNLNASYQPSADDIAAGSVLIELRDRGTSECARVRDTIQIFFENTPVVDAGPDRTRCTNELPFTLEGTGNPAVWSGGTGTFSNVNDFNSTYTPTDTEIANGSVTLTLTTVANGTCPSVSDQVTFTILPAPEVEAGEDQTMCGNETSISLAGTITNATGGQWTTSGTGTFSNTTDLNATYTPSTADKNAGTVVLTLTSVDNGFTCPTESDALTLTITPPITVSAGPDLTVCENADPAQLAGTVTEATGGAWTSSGSGTFNPSNTDLNATYTPSAADLAAGSVTLTLNTTGNGGCPGQSDQMVITYTPAPTADAGTDQTVCEDVASISLSGSVTAPAAGGQWTTSGTGTFTPNPFDLNTSYVPSAADAASGSITFTLNTTGNQTCNTVTDEVTVTFEPAPVADAGADQTVCANVEFVQLSGQVENATANVWTTSGSGTFSDANSLASTYTPSANDTTLGFVVLTLTATGNTAIGCGTDADQVRIDFTPAPVVDAGPDFNVCADNNAVQLSATYTRATGVLWSTLGSGTFSNSTADNPTYSPSTADTTAGSVILVVQATGITGCSDVTDTLTLTINPAPVVVAGNDTTLCEGGDLQLSGLVQNALGGIWATSGTGIFVPSASDLNATYQPSQADINAGAVSLTLTSQGNGLCGGVQSSLLLTIQPLPTVNAGTDDLVCANTAGVALNGSISNASGATWETGGTGSFSPNATDLNASYVPSAADLTAGSVQLNLVSDVTDACSSFEDSVVITFQPMPMVDAGDDVTICENADRFTLNGTIDNATGGIWTTDHYGEFFPSVDDLDAEFVINGSHEEQVTAPGTWNVILTSQSDGICPSVSDSFTLVLTPKPVVNAGDDIVVCSNDSSAIALNDASVSGASGGVWSTSGTGQFFPNAATVNASYQPSAADLAAGTITLSLMSTGNGTCTPVTDELVITIEPGPTAEAGADVTICESNPVVNLNGVATNATTTTWFTSSGEGTFSPNANDLNATFTPSASQIAAGVVVIRLEVQGGAQCPVAEDRLTVLIDRTPEVDAGSDFSMCENVTDIQLSGTYDHTSGIIWSTLGSGTFVDATDANTTYSPSAADLAAGNVQLVLTTQANGACIGQDDTLAITFTTSPTADAGPATTCADENGIDLQGTVTVASGGLWTSSGSGTFTVNSGDGLDVTYVPSAADMTAGSVQLTLTTTGNGTCVPASDVIDISLSPAATVEAGTDQVICASDVVTIAGTVNNATGGTWTTSGSGSFANAGALNTTYTPSASDLAGSTVMLYLTTTGNPCKQVVDSMKVTFAPVPTVEAGPNQFICADESTINLDGSLTVAGNGRWSTVAGTGTFLPNENDLQASYQLSAADLAAGQVEFVLESIYGFCPTVTDTMTLTINGLPTIDVGVDIDLCNNIADTALTATTTNATGVIWSTTGTGTFSPDNNSFVVDYAPSAADLAAGSVLISATTEGSALCPTATDQLVMTFAPAPTASVTMPSACSESDTISLSGSYTNASGIVWTTTGAGSFFPSATNPNAYYIKGAGETGSVDFTLTTTGNGVCAPATAVGSINLTPLPKADAGIDDIVCVVSPQISLNGSVVNATGGTWTSMGSGSFGNANALNTTYNPSATDIASGSVQLVLTTTGNGICALDTDTVEVTISDKPTVDAGPDVQCAIGDTIQLGARITDATGATWTTSDGTGIFFPSANQAYTSYLPSAADFASGDINFTVTTTGGCTDESQNIQMYFVQPPIADAGSDNSFCETVDDFDITGLVGVNDLGWWTTLGDGVFADTLSLVGNYTPSDDEKARGYADLVLNSKKNASFCPIAQDTLRIDFEHLPTVDAGPAEICSDQTDIPLSATYTNASGVVWSHNGSGSFNPVNGAITDYRVGAGETGVVTATVTTQGEVLCPATTDQVEITIQPMPLADAGADLEVCDNVTDVPLTGTVTNATTGTWTTTGSGTFTDANALSTSYQPSASDIASGTVVLSLTTTHDVCMNHTDRVTLTFTPSPTVSVADTTICTTSDDIVFFPTSSDAIAYNWTTSGAGSFVDATNENGNYVIDASDYSAGSFTVTVTVQGDGVCTDVSDNATVTINQGPTLSATPEISCADIAGTQLDATYTDATGVRWSTSGSGLFTPDFTLDNPLYIPSPDDELQASVDLYVETTGNGLCEPARDTVSVYPVSPPSLVATAVADTVCAGIAGVSLDADMEDATGVIWSTNGTGTFDDNTSLTPVYEPSVQDTTNGSVIFFVETTGNGTCKPAYDTVQVGFSSEPVASVDLADQSICASQNEVDLEASFRNATGGLWTTLGSGIFSPTDVVTNPAYRLSADDKSNGSVQVVFQTTGQRFCPPATDTLNITIQPLPIVDAGVDTLDVCETDNVINLNGTVTNATGGTWTTTGNGTFSDVTDLNGTYTLSDNDIADSVVVLTLTSTGNALCEAETNNLRIHVVPMPVANAGMDEGFCADIDSVFLNPSLETAVRGEWQTMGTGTFSADSSAYVPSNADKTAGSVNLVYEAFPYGSCTSDFDTVTFTFRPVPSADAGDDLVVCGDTAGVFISGSFTNAGNGGWTTTGSGVFLPMKDSINATYRPSDADIELGQVGLVFRTTGNGICASARDTLVLDINPVPVLDAGQRQTICADQPLVDLSGSYTGNGSVRWTSPTGGTFANNADTVTTYAITAQDISAETVTLTLTYTDAGLCKPQTDEVTITILPTPVVDAGPDLTFCADVGTFDISGSVENAGGGVWNVNGDGSFIPSEDSLEITYYVAPVDTAQGSLTFVLTSTDNKGCMPVSDTVEITLTPTPKVMTFGDTTICTLEDSVQISGDITVASGGMWSTNGTGIFAPSSADLTTYYYPSAKDRNLGQLTLTLTSTGNGLCNAYEGTSIVTFVTPPTVNAGTDQTICADADTIYLQADSDASGIVWSTTGTGAFVPDANTLKASYVMTAEDTVAGGVAFTLQTDPTQYCASVNDKVVYTINPAPKVDAGIPVTVCADTAGIELNGSVMHATGGLWSTTGSGTFKPTTSDLGATYVPSVADTANGSVNLVLTSSGAGKCKAVMDTVTITIDPAPAITADQARYCKDETGGMLSGSSLHAGGISWTTAGGGIFTPSAFGDTVSYVPSLDEVDAGESYITLTTEATGLCKPVSETVRLIIKDLPTVNAGPDLIHCDNDEVFLVGEVDINATSVWLNASGDTVSFPEMLDADMEYVLAVLDNQGCRNADTVAVSRIPRIDFNLDPLTCHNLGEVFDTDPQGDIANGNFEWFVNGTIQNRNAPTIEANTAGSYVVVYNEGNCTTIDSTYLRGNPKLYSQDWIMCEDDTLEIRTTNQANVTYDWSPKGNIISGDGTNKIQVSVNTITTFLVTGTDQFGCIGMDTILVETRQVPELEIVGGEACDQDTVLLDATPSNITDPLEKYTWYKDGQLLEDSLAVYGAVNTGTYKVEYSIGECMRSDTADLLFNPLPVADNVDRVPFCPDDTIAILDAGPAYTYYWYHDESTSQIVEVDLPDVYPVDLINEFNCKITDTLIAERACPPQVVFPNTITPDCACPNGYFGPAFKDVGKFQMWVYNRWGEVMFYTEDPDEHWDGTYRGEVVPVGVYPWRANWEGDSDEYKGPFDAQGKVTVVR